MRNNFINYFISYRNTLYYYLKRERKTSIVRERHNRKHPISERASKENIISKSRNPEAFYRRSVYCHLLVAGKEVTLLYGYLALI